MLQLSLFENGLEIEKLCSYQEETLASHTVRQGKGKGSSMKDISGHKCSELSEDCTPIGLLTKMCLEAYPSELRLKNAMTWKMKAIGSNHFAYQLVPLERTTFAKEFSLWPTLTASEWKGVSRDRFYGSSTYRSDKLASRFRKQKEDLTHLNPDYAEAFMGFPTGWTVLNA